FLTEQAAYRRQPKIGIQAQATLGDGAKAPSGPGAQALAYQQSDPHKRQTKHYGAGQVRERGVVQRRSGQAAEQQCGEQDEVVQALGTGPEGFTREALPAQNIASDDQREQGPKGEK